ncbi:MAG: pitrilysin family protein [Pseudomonadota bacterium]
MKPFGKTFWGMKSVRYGASRFLICSVILLCCVTPLSAASVTDGARKFQLDNGVTVILKQDDSAPVAAIQVWVKTGSANETEEEAGITHLIEHMIFKGTPSKKTGEIARTIEASGGHINAYTSFDRTVYYVEIASAQFDIGLDVLLDAVQHSLFDTEELEREKEVVLEEYRRSLDIPESRLSRAMMNLCYTKHPYRRPIIGYEETIRTLDRKAILNYVDKWYTPANMVLVAVGDFDTEKALKTIRDLVRNFPERPGKVPSRPEEPAQTALRKIIKNDKVQQVYLNVSWHIPSLTHEDTYPLNVLEIILGKGKSSRLYSRLKMNANLVYSIGGGAYAFADPGLFSLDATLSPDNIGAALGAIGKEISKITREQVSESELTKARTIAEADFVFDMEDMSGQARTLAFFQTMTGDMYNADHYLDNLKKVTPDDIVRVAKKYLRPENLSVGILSPEGTAIALEDQTIISLFTPVDQAPSPEGVEGTEGQKKAVMVVLPNSMRLIIKENHRLPEVSIIGAFLGGTRLEKPGKWGISNFVGDMLTRGTKERTASEIASTVESWAGSLSGFSGRNSIGVTAKFLSKDLYAGMELLADVVLNVAFPQSEMEKVRDDILADIKAKKDRPTAQLFDLFYKTLYPDYPYGHPLTGTTETIRSITRSDLEEWYYSVAIPSNFVLTVVGDLKKDQLIPYVKALFSTFLSSEKKLPHIAPAPAPLAEAREAHQNRPGAQTHLIIGYLGVDLKSEDNPPMALVKTSLAGQGGRLFSQLRDKQSLAYAITAFRRPGLETGAFGAYLACDPNKTAVATAAVFEELNKIREEGLTDRELVEAKSYLMGNLLIGLQTNGSQAMQMTLDELYGLGYNNLPKFISNINAVTLDDIKRSARKVIVPGKYVLVTVGPDKAMPPVETE